jgi:hypothetical protein
MLTTRHPVQMSMVFLMPSLSAFIHPQISVQMPQVTIPMMPWMGPAV